jgi:aspartate/methionine/tyrosine aminotransferase
MIESRRIQAVQPPIIPWVANLIRQNPGTISLGQGVVWYPPPPQSVGRIAEFQSNPELHKYQAVFGIPQLIEAIEKKLLSDNGILVDQSGLAGASGQGRRIFVTAGSNMGFINALLAIADIGDEVILNTPCYFNHEMAIVMAGCRPVLVPTDEHYQLQPDLIAAAITPRTRAIVTVSPNNPTGAVYPESVLREVNRLCQEHCLYHIHDEAYEYFTYNGIRHFSPGSISGSEPHTISLFSLSKSFGFASWRIGYQVVPEALSDAINKIQDTVLICPPVISQFAALGALDAGADYCRQRIGDFAGVREIAISRLQQLGDRCIIPTADGAFYFLLRIDTRLSPLELVRRLIEEFHVAAIPGSAFGVTDATTLRVSYGALRPETVLEGLDRLVHGLQAII